MNNHRFFNENNATTSIPGFPKLEACRAALEQNGVSRFDATGWRKQILSAAADLLAHGEVAGATARESLLVLVASATPNDVAVPAPLDFTLTHPSGQLARAKLQFAPVGEGETLEASELVTVSDSKEKLLWVTLDTLSKEDVSDVVIALAARDGDPPGSILSIIGAGALVALVQSMDVMNAQRNDARLSGFGDDTRRFDVLVQIQIGEALVIPKPKGPSF